MKARIIWDAPGQTCNRLWSYLDTVAWAIKNGGKVYILHWDNDIKYFRNILSSKYTYFPFYSPFFIKMFGENRWRYLFAIFYLNRFARSFFKTMIGKRLGFVEGWEKRDSTDYYPSVRAMVVDFFLPNPDICKQVEEVISEYKKKGFYIIGVHIRGGDYRTWHNGEYFFETVEYTKYMSKIEELFENRKVCFFISSNEKQDYNLFSRYEIIKHKNASAIHDLYMLSKCDRIIGPHSSFSRWASFIGNVPLYYMEHNNYNLADSDFSIVKDFYHFENGKRIEI